MFLTRGQRGVLIGKTGSGKSVNGLFQLLHTDIWPKIIIDTKIEDEFVSLQQDGSTIELFTDIKEFQAFAAKTIRKNLPDIILIRPNMHEMMEPEILDEYVNIIYNNFGAVFTYIDEVGQLHKNGRALPGLMNLLTRGRKRGKTTLMGNQRPALISRSVITESDKFYIYKLTDQKDWDRLSDVVPGADKLPKLDPYHFGIFPMPNTKIRNCTDRFLNSNTNRKNTRYIKLNGFKC